MTGRLRPPRADLETVAPYEAREPKVGVNLAANENPHNLPREVLSTSVERLCPIMRATLNALSPAVLYVTAPPDGLKATSDVTLSADAANTPPNILIRPDPLILPRSTCNLLV